ncbi:DUF2868 domain-containing protein [Pseudidiomarina terrestris]|uniref:DUF2868 domain-containing protein n=1 Tax=Pseudidiomarina terrestris TaxID=2820060 RepID=UPI0026514BAA|nr:DUF2868 domain-containing protein [Pseudidiomarina sp. 1ASP75-5]MDN7135227.1 DUF2868 domain-containing protein [Pseudidiomarina sp. 1ASP75-5]
MVFSRFEQFWLAEYQRQHDQADLPKQLQALDLRELDASQSTRQQLLTRALRIAERRGTATQLNAWQRNRRLLTVVMGFTALILGMLATQAVLTQAQPLSLLFALILLLLPNLVMLLLWLLLHFNSHKPHGITAVGLQVMNWLGAKTSRQSGFSERPITLSEAWLRHVQQQRLLAPLMALASHGFWLLISLSSWLTLLLYLSFNDYQFHWATTILQQPQLVAIAELLNSVPGLLFDTQVPLPTESGGDNEFANLAGRWLASCVLVYAILPRALLVLLSLAWFAVKVRRMRLDERAPGHVAVVQALRQQQHQPQVVDPDQGQQHEDLQFNYAEQGQGQLVASLDYEANPKWGEGSAAANFGVIDSHARKRALLDELQQQPRQEVAMRIAANLTPDRSSLRFLAQLAPFTRTLRVQLVTTEGDTYLSQWQSLLDRYGVHHVTL